MTELLLNFDMTTTCNIHLIGHFVVFILLNKHINDVMSKNIHYCIQLNLQNDYFIISVWVLNCHLREISFCLKTPYVKY